MVVKGEQNYAQGILSTISHLPGGTKIQVSPTCPIGVSNFHVLFVFLNLFCFQTII